MTKKSLLCILIFAVALTMCHAIIVKDGEDEPWTRTFFAAIIGFSASAAVRNFRE